VKRLLFAIIALLMALYISPDAFSQRVIATVAVGQRPIYVAVDQKTNRIYVSNQTDNTVSVIDGVTNQVLDIVKVGRYPNGIAVDSNTNTIYVANLGSGSLSIISGDKLTVSTLWLGSYPAKVAVNPSTDRVYVTLEDQSGFVAVVNGKSHKLIASVSVLPFPLSVAVDTASNQIYVADFLCGCGQISVVDGATNEVMNEIEVPGAALLEGVAVDSKNNFVYATDENSGFYVIDLTTGQVLGQVSDVKYPNEVTAIPGTTFAVEPDSGSNRAVFINAVSFAVEKRVRVGKSPTGVAVNATTKRAYVTNALSNTVSVIQLPHSW
jgi:YVTN family beta-propeller protein